MSVDGIDVHVYVVVVLTLMMTSDDDKKTTDYGRKTTDDGYDGYRKMTDGDGKRRTNTRPTTMHAY